MRRPRQPLACAGTGARQERPCAVQYAAAGLHGWAQGKAGRARGQPAHD
jgi:hypothetical protein